MRASKRGAAGTPFIESILHPVKRLGTRRRWSWILLGLLGGLIVVALFRPASATGGPVVINGTAAPPLPALDPDRVAQGAALYARNCAQCHGANLEGAPAWKQRLADGSFPPPPHDSSGHTWHHSDALLLQIMAEGGDPAYDSKMPGFQDRLRRDELTAILDFIKSRWGKNELEFQWWITKTQDTS